MLALPREVSIQLFKPLIQNEIDERLKFLSSLPIFEGIPSHYLVPIASNIKPTSFTYGEYILKEEEVPQGLYIVHKGQAIAVGERIGRRSVTTD